MESTVQLLRDRFVDHSDRLIRALKRAGDRSWRAACRVLQQIGTSRSLPQLKKIASGNVFFTVKQAAESAIQAIEIRERTK